jgi:hypothetical protein
MTTNVPPNLAPQPTPHRRGTFRGIMPSLGGVGPLSVGIIRRSWSSRYGC